jgi:glutathione S-transferase
MMKLYNAYLSNFASKCRISIYEKKAPVEIATIPGGDLKSAEYLKLNPLGKIPSLDTGNGVIAESETINEFLEDKFPEPALLPKDAEGRARARTISRFHDLYLEPPMRALFPQLAVAEKDTKLIGEKLADIATRLDQLEAMIGAPYATGSQFTLGDAALVPTFFFLNALLPLFGAKGPLDGHPKIAAWWAEVQKKESVQKVLAEQGEAMAKYQKTGQIS